jgi:hypothetical protein
MAAVYYAQGGYAQALCHIFATFLPLSARSCRFLGT